MSNKPTHIAECLPDLVCYCLTLHYSGERYAYDLFNIITQMKYHYTIGLRPFHSIRKIQSRGI